MLFLPSCAWLMPAFAAMMASLLGIPFLRALSERQYPRRPAWMYRTGIILLVITLALFGVLLIEVLSASRSGAGELCGLKF